jgi:hypothetical protein
VRGKKKKEEHDPSVWTGVYRCDFARRGTSISREVQVFTVAGNRREARRVLLGGLFAIPEVEGVPEEEVLYQLPPSAWVAFVEAALERPDIRFVLPKASRLMPSMISLMVHQIMTQR